jgi:uracil-DNA glycosylase family 4
MRLRRNSLWAGHRHVRRHEQRLDMIESLVKSIPADLLARSGKVFYSGRQAFTARSSLYVLGVNPGGAPENHQAETIGEHTNSVLRTYPDNWCAYRDESWEGHVPGTFGMAPRVLHLFEALGLDPGAVPASNLVFVRSARESNIAKQEMMALADQCWEFHARAITALQPRAILCFGKTAGNYVRKKTDANELVAEFVESNSRRWRSQAYATESGLLVVAATHPSIADWTAGATDPTHLVRESMK